MQQFEKEGILPLQEKSKNLMRLHYLKKNISIKSSQNQKATMMVYMNILSKKME